MDFEWDESKNGSNLAKHGVSFELVHEFDWERANLRVDDRKDYGEDRFMAYGPAGDGQLYVVVFTVRGARYRIISVRHFGRKDHLFYDRS